MNWTNEEEEEEDEEEDEEETGEGDDDGINMVVLQGLVDKVARKEDGMLQQHILDHYARETGTDYKKSRNKIKIMTKARELLRAAKEKVAREKGEKKGSGKKEAKEIPAAKKPKMDMAEAYKRLNSGMPGDGEEEESEEEEEDEDTFFNDEDEYIGEYEYWNINEHGKRTLITDPHEIAELMQKEPEEEHWEGDRKLGGYAVLVSC